MLLLLFISSGGISFARKTIKMVLLRLLRLLFLVCSLSGGHASLGPVVSWAWLPDPGAVTPVRGTKFIPVRQFVEFNLFFFPVFYLPISFCCAVAVCVVRRSHDYGHCGRQQIERVGVWRNNHFHVIRVQRRDVLQYDLVALDVGGRRKRYELRHRSPAVAYGRTARKNIIRIRH